MSGTLFGLPMIDGITFLLYLAAIIGIGFYCSKKIENAKDFTSAGQNLTLPLILGSVLASWFGAYSGAGGPEYIYNVGMVAFTTFLGYHVGLFGLACLAKPLRASGAVTFPEFISTQFGDKARTASSIASILTLIGTTAGQFIACGTVAELLGLCSFQQGIVFGGIIIVVLTITGGLYGVALTDTVQQIFITCICVIAVPAVAFSKAGGFTYVMENTDPARLSLLSGLAPVAILSAFAANALAFATDPAFAQRIFAAKDIKSAVVGSHLGNLLAVIMSLPIFLAVFTIPFIFPEMTIASQFAPTTIITYMPPVIKGIGIGAFSSLLLTTGDTYLLTTASVVTTDIMPKFRPNASDKDTLLWSRLTTVATGVVCILLGLYLQNIYNAITLFYGAYGAAITVPVFISCIAKDKVDNRVVAPSIYITLIAVVAIDVISGTRNGVFFGVAISLLILLGGTIMIRNKDANKTGA